MLAPKFITYAFDKKDMSGSAVSLFVHDDDGTYLGYLSVEGFWIIMKQSTADSVDSYRFAGGKSGYAEAWTGRAALTYNLISAMA